MRIAGIEFFRTTYSHSIHKPTSLDEKVQKAVGGSSLWSAGSVVESMKNWVVEKIHAVQSLFSEPTLYESAKDDETLISYANWHRELNESFKAFHFFHRKGDHLDEQFRVQLFMFWEKCLEKGILSPVAFSMEIERLLAAKTNTKYQTAVEELKDTFIQQLKNCYNVREVFLHDISYLLVTLSAGKMEVSDFFSHISLYKKALKKWDYRRAISQLKNWKLEELTKNSYVSLMRSLKRGALTTGCRRNHFFEQHPYYTTALLACAIGGVTQVNAQPFPLSFNLNSLDGSNGFVVEGKNSSLFGFSVNYGSLNSSGSGILSFGALHVNEVYGIYASRSFPSLLNLTSLTNNPYGFISAGNSSSTYFGQSIATGDFNGDNNLDLFIGVTQTYGQCYVIFGPFQPFMSALSLNGNNGFVINANVANDGFGTSVASGDINNDGLDDVLIGAPNNNACYAFFGSRTSQPATINVSTLNGSNGFVASGASATKTGYSVASADINKDKVDDFLIGSNAGNQVSVIYGASTFPSFFNLTNLDGVNGVVFYQNTNQFSFTFGFYVGSGDMNNDGFPDLLVGDPGDGGYAEGQAYVIFASSVFPSKFYTSQINGTNGFVVNGIADYDNIGYSLGSGDINQDGFNDLLIGAPLVLGSAGRCYIMYGSSSFPASINLINLNGTNGFYINGNSGDNLCYSIASGDINNDTIVDLMMGTNGANRAYVLFGRNTSASATSSTGGTIGPQTSGTTLPSTSGNPTSSTTGSTATNQTSSGGSRTTSIIVGIIVALALGILGGSGAYIYYRRRKRSSIEDIDRHKIIGGKYALVNNVNRAEAAEIKRQKGYEIVVPERQETVEVRLSSGRFGNLRFARIRNIGEYCAVKKINAENIEASRREAAIQAYLTGGPHILPLLDSSERLDALGQPFKLYLFSPFAGFGDGKKLGKLLKHLSRTAKTKMIVHVARSLLKGFQYMHSKGVYHLDFKPKNMVITKEGYVYIIDFGCARWLKDREEIGMEDETIGDNRYFAPERLAFTREEFQFRNVPAAERADKYGPAKIDTWAIGMTLWELELGEFPLDRLSGGERIANWDAAYFSNKLMELKNMVGTLPDPLISLIHGMLNPDRDRRLWVSDALNMPIFKRKEYAFNAGDELKEMVKNLMNIKAKPEETQDQEPPRADCYYSPQYLNKDIQEAPADYLNTPTNPEDPSDYLNGQELEVIVSQDGSNNYLNAQSNFGPSTEDLPDYLNARTQP